MSTTVDGSSGGTVITTTGGVVPGTSGNVLTSDGTNWTSSTPAAPAATGFNAFLLSGM